MHICITPCSYQHNELLAFIITKYITKLERMWLFEIKEDPIAILCWAQLIFLLQSSCTCFKTSKPESAWTVIGKMGLRCSMEPLQLRVSKHQFTQASELEGWCSFYLLTQLLSLLLQEQHSSVKNLLSLRAMSFPSKHHQFLITSL